MVKSSFIPYENVVQCSAKKSIILKVEKGENDVLKNPGD